MTNVIPSCHKKNFSFSGFYTHDTLTMSFQLCTYTPLKAKKNDKK
jgi:hypothetical protein